MNQRPTQFTRFRVMSALALPRWASIWWMLFNIQVVHHDDYLAQSIQTITRVDNVPPPGASSPTASGPDSCLQPVRLQPDL